MKEMGMISEDYAPSEEEKSFTLYDDLSSNSLQALLLYSYLPDKIDGMSGWYGKDFASLEYIMDLCNIRNRIRVFELLQVCISEHSKEAAKQREKINDKSIKS